VAHPEVDETFIGGRARFMHKHKRDRVIKGTGPMYGPDFVHASILLPEQE
jgi:hypothetical protein